MIYSPAGPSRSEHNVIISPDDIAKQILKSWHDAGLTWKPKARWFPRMPAHLEKIFGLLFTPGEGEGDDVDAILFADERHSSPLHNIRDFAGGLQTPMIDLRGRAGDFADAHFDTLEAHTWAETWRCISRFRQRREALATQYRHAIDPEIQLISHMYVSGRDLRGLRYPLTPEAICYPGFFSAAKIIPLAEKLALRGFLKKTFFDRLYECRTCRSRRLSVREECPSCRSADVHESALIHHFHCASILPEEQFRHGSKLICPKCQRQLRNYGKDYDKPGQAFTCNACEATTSELEVGFICLDCNARMDGEGADRTDLYSYALTDVARTFLEGNITEIAASLPVSVQREIARINTMSGTLAGLAEIRFANGERIIATNGRSVFEKSRDLFFENLSNRLGGAGSLHVSGDIAYIFAEPFDAAFERELRLLVANSEEVLRHKLAPRLSVTQRYGRV